MRRLIEKIEKYLIRVAALSLLALVLVQGLMTSDPIRFYLSWGERMEGQTIELPVSSAQSASQNAAQSSNSGFIVISTGKYASLPMSALRINGEIKTYLDQNETKVQIFAGDVIEIDSSYYQYPIDYKITAVSENLAFPQKGWSVSVNQSVVMLGKVIVK